MTGATEMPDQGTRGAFDFLENFNFFADKGLTTRKIHCRRLSRGPGMAKLRASIG